MRKKKDKETKISKSNKKRRRIESDEDEDPIPLDKKETSNTKAVSVSEFFGNGPIKRESKTHQENKKLKENCVHEDHDFEETLKQLNQTTQKETKSPAKIKSVKKETKSPIKARNTEKEIESPAKAKKIEIEVPSKAKQKQTRDSGKFQDDSRPKKKSKPSSSIEMEVIKNPKKSVTAVVSADKDTSPAVKKPKPKGSANYASYLNREGPKALGSKEIPEGEEACLAGLTFIVTGILESMERDEAKSLIEKYGGKVMSTISKNTKYIVIGRDAGASKLDKAEKFGTKQLDEDGLLDLIRTMPGKNGKSKQKNVKEEKCSTSSTVSKQKNAKEEKYDTSSTVSRHFSKQSNSSEVELMEEDDDLFAEVAEPNEDEIIGDNKKLPEQKRESEHDVPDSLPQTKSPEKVKKVGENLSMWVDKYKPTTVKQIIGQQGDKSNAKKLLHWLLNWHKNRRLNKKPMAPGRWNAQDDGSGYKAALLSGPPGVGKTTTAQLVCKETGYDYFELNASDTRSKKYLQQSVSQLLGNQTLADCFKDSSAGKVSSNHVIVMDEVDGMAGNEDRGGMRELIDFIKASKVPIICICNDRNHTKIRSLSNYCFDLRFQKPRVEQIKAAMMSIAFKEGIKVPPNALQDVIVASNQDVRQVLHNMSMWSAKSKGLSLEQTKQDIGRGTKHIKMGPFDVLRDVFSIGNNPKATIMDKSDLFFHDYSIAPLFVQENYLYVMPKAAEGDKKKHLNLLSQAADSICIGDVIDRQIRNQNSWGLLPTQAIFASVVPGDLLCGNLRQMINFPAWLGKNSNRNHMDRVLQELHVHMRMKITGNKTDVNLEYLPLLKRALTKPLINSEQEGIPDVLKTMEYYHLLREDFDSVIDLSLWPNQIDPRSKINTKVKAAFTRTYNKECSKNPYAVTNVKKKKGSAANADENLGEEENALESEEEEDDKLENDAMIKVKKPSKKATQSQSEASTSKERKKNSSKKGKTK
ncbi:replication factor C subunit 1-like isoform X2 [Uloborus diversus]|uniref:replication factor C subunit 1-like isoform X2 n=1 Tax=Uloborus diversus TaxID=327109 RepID=UPI00240A8E1F|nr:replication factor C subunit 1-like isoform X2 [Uloborus diversus]